VSNERVKYVSGSRRVLISEIEGDGLFVVTPAPKLGVPVTEEEAMRLALKENAKGQARERVATTRLTSVRV
jgi:hypothetical protein